MTRCRGPATAFYATRGDWTGIDDKHGGSTPSHRDASAWLRINAPSRR